MYNIEELKEKLEELRNSIDNGMLIPITNITKVVLDDTIDLINSLEILEKNEEFISSKINSVRKYLNILEEIMNILTFLPNIESYEDTFYDDITKMIDSQYNKYLVKLKNIENSQLRK